MAKQSAIFTVEVEYDDEHTDVDWIAYSLDKVMETLAARGTGIFEDNGALGISEFHPVSKKD